ncbi:MAG TPA: HDOD domain-containing protein, partial [Anaerolineaceae bacterium]|nr:HDOD domain-containing protein [Anaerolineaceae bacterium]
IATAVGCQWLARSLRYPNPEEAYVGGLLHDMGKLVLDQFVVLDYPRMVTIMQRNNLLLSQVEEHVFGIDHAAVGSVMSGKWNFPPVLEDAIRYHHSPSLAHVSEPLAAIVNIADAIMHQIEPRTVLTPAQVIHPESLRILSLSERRLAVWQDEITRLLSTVDKTAIPV